MPDSVPSNLRVWSSAAQGVGMPVTQLIGLSRIKIQRSRGSGAGQSPDAGHQAVADAGRVFGIAVEFAGEQPLFPDSPKSQRDDGYR
ncbi:hypothetical protein DE4587_02600 [Mycobacteroides salmoniphilum]|nr:hypothetical protein DE4586_00002 [Mycobacteroides salmoniphilum]TDZ86166.1 hypothetical protein DE4587_02600 [Mycobacteroides salmoniphilum]